MKNKELAPLIQIASTILEAITNVLRFSVARQPIKPASEMICAPQALSPLATRTIRASFIMATCVPLLSVALTLTPHVP